MRLSPRLLVVPLIAVGLIAAPSAATARAADDHPSAPAHVPPPISAQEFLAKAAAANRFEIVTGELAQERARSAAVRALGAEFVRDHTALLAQGSAVAAQLGITVPEGLTPAQERIVARLARLTGRRFDRAWLAAQIAAHEQALALHLRGAIRGELPQIRTLALGGLPVVAHHYGELLDLVADHRGHGSHREHARG
jgi:putative membrane protein